MTVSLPDDEINNFLINPMECLAYPCHTQSVERGIQLISEAASHVIGAENRDGFIRQRMRSRKELGRCDNKAAFFPKLEKL